LAKNGQVPMECPWIRKGDYLFKQGILRIVCIFYIPGLVRYVAGLLMRGKSSRKPFAEEHRESLAQPRRWWTETRVLFGIQAWR